MYSGIKRISVSQAVEDLERFVGEHSGEHFLLNGQSIHGEVLCGSLATALHLAPAPSGWMAVGWGREVLALLGVFGRLDGTGIETGWNPGGNLLICFLLNLP